MTRKIFSYILIFVLIASGFFLLTKNKDKNTKEETKIDKPNFVWTEGPQKAEWKERDAHTTTVFKDKIWLVGGVNPNDETEGKLVKYWDSPHYSDIWSSEDGEKWNLVTEKAPWKNVRSVSLFVFKDKIWLLGGWNQYDYKYENGIWSSEDGVNWKKATSTTPIWAPREGQSVVELNGRLWFMGGVDFQKREAFNDLWYSDDGWNWKQASSSLPWEKRYDQTVSVFDNKIILTGGIRVGGKEFDDVWSSTNGFDWKLETDNPGWSARNGHILLPFKNYLILAGGWQGDLGLNDTWYTKDGKNWQKTDQNGPWLGREDHAAVVFHDKIIMNGGMDSNLHWNNDTWILNLLNNK